MKQRNKRKLIIYGLLGVLMLTTVAYAVLQTTLNISGTVTKKGGSWNIYFTNPSTASTTGDAKGSSITLEATNLTFNVDLLKPNDSVTYTVDIKNGGSIDAILDSLSLIGFDVAESNDVIYKITYQDGTEIKNGDTLNVNETRTIKIFIKYDDVSTLATSDVKLTLKVVLTYVQTGGSQTTPGTDDSNIQLLGDTPYTLNQGLSKVILQSDSSDLISYTVQSDTVYDLMQQTPVLSDMTLEDKGGYYEITNTGGSVWYQSKAVYTVSNLTAGSQYNIVLDSSDVDLNSTILVPYVVISDGDNNLATFPSYQNNALEYRTITAPSSGTITVVLYTESSQFSVGTQARFNKLYINRIGTEYSTPYSVSGSFVGKQELTDLPKNTTITSTPSCKLYKVNSGETTVKSKLQDKTIVSFGDSIVGNASAPNDYPSVIAELTGANVINVGFGGCRMSSHPIAAYDAFSMYNLVNSITTKDWSKQDGVGSDAEISNKEEHLAALKAIDWNNVDIITIGYGTNDAGGGVALDYDNDKFSTSSYLGALRYSIEKISTAYPHIKIMILSPIYRYWNDTNEDSDSKMIVQEDGSGSVHFYDYVDKLIECAETDLSIPAVDMYRTINFNINTKDQYFESDGVHPNVKGLRVMGKRISEALLATF